MDASPKSKQWTVVLGDKGLDDTFGKIIYVALDFKKDGEDEKKYEVTSAPSLLLIDPTKEESKPKKISSPAPGSLKKEIESLIKSMTAKK
jgi:hypothetical protein